MTSAARMFPDAFRKARAEHLTGKVRFQDEHTAFVPSVNVVDGGYIVARARGGWVCQCPHAVYRQVFCKHAAAVTDADKVRQRRRQATVERNLDAAFAVVALTLDGE
jgi:hypothetical protein